MVDSLLSINVPANQFKYYQIKQHEECQDLFSSLFIFKII